MLSRLFKNDDLDFIDCFYRLYFPKVKFLDKVTFIHSQNLFNSSFLFSVSFYNNKSSIKKKKKNYHVTLYINTKLVKIRSINNLDANKEERFSQIFEPLFIL